MQTPARFAFTLVASTAIVSIAVAQEKLSAPFSLIENQGQWTDAAAYCSPRGQAATVWFVRDGFVMDLRSFSKRIRPEDKGGDEDTDPDQRVVLRATFEETGP